MINVSEFRNSIGERLIDAPEIGRDNLLKLWGEIEPQLTTAQIPQWVVGMLCLLRADHLKKSQAK